jgi:type II secretory pathway predicted ATPase ExeA
MSYEQYYGLFEQPFSNTPDPRFYFETAQQSDVIKRLMYAIDSMKGLAVVIGDLGTGKTTVARRLYEGLDNSAYEAALLVVIHSSVTPEWLLRKIGLQLGLESTSEEKVVLLGEILRRLEQIHADGKKAVVIIDEANMLQDKAIMEELRGLLNLEVPGSKLITFVLLGLPELENYLSLDQPLAQRIALKCRLTSLKLETTKAYIHHRMRIAGCKRQVFSDSVIELVHHYSRGIPRLINTICDNALLEAFLLKKEAIEPDLIREVVADLGLITPPKGESKGVSP